MFKTIMEMLCLLLLAFAIAGCADIRVPLAYTDGHLRKMKPQIDRARAQASPGPGRERLDSLAFHVTRALAWSAAMLKHKGAPAPMVTVPASPEDRREVIEEDLARRAYNAAVEQEARLKAAASGWLGLLGLGGGLTGGGGLIALFLRHRKKLLAVIAGKDRAIDQYDIGADSLTKSTRNKQFTGEDLVREHKLRKT